jgi:hypothetical protein
MSTCACGMPYENTADGRWAHRTIHGHSPCPPRGDVPA